MNEGRSPAFYWLAAFFALFVLFLYGPMIVIFILSFQGPTGGLTFPMNGVSLHWFDVCGRAAASSISSGAFKRSLELGARRDGADRSAVAERRPRVPQDDSSARTCCSSSPSQA